MAYAIQFDQSLNDERKRIAIEQIDKSLAEMRDDAFDLHERVHQFRKRAKKIRALLRLFRPVDEAWYQRENARFRDLAARYSELRDSDAALETLANLERHFREPLDSAVLRPVEDELARHRSVRAANDAVDARLLDMQAELEIARSEVMDWADHEMDPDTLVAGFDKTYRRGRKAMRKCLDEDDSAIWHEWRKRAKYQRYQCKLLRPLWPGVINCWRDQLHQLTDLLGEDHDMVVLRELLYSRMSPELGESTISALEGLMSQRSAALRDKSRCLGAKLFHDKPGAVRSRLSHLLKI